MPVLIHTGLQRRKSLCDFPLRLLARGSAPQAPLNTEFHSVAARSANTLKGYAEAPSPLRCHGTNRSTLTA